ncbi:MAG: glycosyltransferase, partial [Candidatus Eremiobacteraeota bacterium]|nr:glycosyltransferase [Candidatus Eremiobacteraeota bacterium]
MPRALASLPEDATVLVLDAESADSTQAIAVKAGARLIVRPWTDFIEARRFALSNVTTSWTLMLDADETLDDELRGDVGAVCDVETGPQPSTADCHPEQDSPVGESIVEGYRISRTTLFCGKPMRIWSGEKLLRLFRTDAASLEANAVSGSDAAVHEHWIVGGAIAELPG